MSETIRVILVDDQPIVRAGFRMILKDEPDIDVVGEGGDGHAAVELAAHLRPDVVVMDVRMPHRNGIEATRDLQAPARGSDHVPRVLMLTAAARGRDCPDGS